MQTIYIRWYWWCWPCNFMIMYVVMIILNNSDNNNGLIMLMKIMTIIMMTTIKLTMTLSMMLIMIRTIFMIVIDVQYLNWLLSVSVLRDSSTVLECHLPFSWFLKRKSIKFFSVNICSKWSSLCIKINNNIYDFVQYYFIKCII